MRFSRRQAVSLGAVAPLVLAESVAAAATTGAARIFHVYARPDGRSHIERVPAPTGRNKPLPVQQVVITTIAKGTEDWHRAPFKTFTLNLTGNIRAEMGDGSSEAIGPGDLVYLEDLSGKGHVTHLLTQVTCLFLHMPEDFDFQAWVKG